MVLVGDFVDGLENSFQIFDGQSNGHISSSLVIRKEDDQNVSLAAG